MQFRGSNYFLSNMYPCSIEYAGYVFSCSESLFQALKATNGTDVLAISKMDGFAAKKYGRRMSPIRPDWNSRRVEAMKLACTLKFQQHPDLLARLKEIQGTITEDNTWNDTFWGVCNGKGLNHLGKILMEIRG